MKEAGFEKKRWTVSAQQIDRNWGKENELA